MLTRVRAAVRTLTPGYFALAMASGIVSIALDQQGHVLASRGLFAVGALAWVVLCALSVWRLVAFRADLVADFRSPQRAFGFFTFVAGTNVLGARAGGEGWYAVTAAALAVAASVWLVLGYVVPWSAVLGRSERPVVAEANGTWFIWVVASQSVAIGAAVLERSSVGDRELLALLAVLAWSVGVFCYAACAVLVTLRLMLYPLAPEDLDPPYWVSMGAVAITVVAGAELADMAATPMAEATRALVSGLSVVFWAFATWLIPVLLAAGAWRHLARRVPLGYGPTWWSIVFPLGMYSVASTHLGRVDQLPLVSAIGAAWLWVAVTAWVVVLVAMARHLVHTLGPSRAGG